MRNLIKDWSIKNRYWLITHLPVVIALLLVWSNIVRIKAMHQYSGYCATSFLVLVLILKPLKIVYPRFILIRMGVGKHKREIGVASFTYAALHAYLFYLKKGGFIKLLPYLIKPAIIPGSLIAFPILLVLAITSNNFSTKRLGYLKWKKIHRTVYIAQYAVLIHMIMVDEILWSLILFVPLIILQYLRRCKEASTVKKNIMTDSSSN